MRPYHCEWLPSFCKEVFAKEIREYNLKVHNESPTSIAFENEYIYWGMHIDDFCYMRSGFYFDKEDTLKRLDVTQLLEYNLEAKDLFFNGINKIFVKRFNQYESLDEIIKSQILLFHEIIESYFLSFFEGEIPDYWEQAIKLPRYDYFKLLGNEFGNE
ncbi:hypothetical protein [Viscerimonas tarda]